MRSLILFPITIFLTSNSAVALDELPDPALNTCTVTDGIACEVKCIRKLGEQCLITHVNFSGSRLKSGMTLWQARFLTCIDANIDLQISPLQMKLEGSAGGNGIGSISAKATSTNSEVEIRKDKNVIVPQGKIEGRKARISFSDFLNSGKSHVDVSMRLELCGSRSNNNTCTMSGKLVATTDPNIRCNFHDVTKPGAFVPATVETSTGFTNSRHPVGRTGPIQ